MSLGGSQRFQEVGVYNDSKVLVRRLICLQGDAQNMLDIEKFRLELRNALAEPGGARGWVEMAGWWGFEGNGVISVGSMEKSLRNMVSLAHKK